MTLIMSDPFWLLKPPYTLITSGMFILFLAVVYTFIGKAWTRTRWVYRAGEPKWYWFEVAMCYLVGVGLIGLYLYQAN